MHDFRASNGPKIALAIMGLLYIALAATSLITDSVTAEEFGHLPAGYNLLHSGDFRYGELNPPLMNMLSALPVCALAPGWTAPSPNLPPALRYSFWANGYFFMVQHREHYHGLFVAARMVTVFLVALLGLLGFVWARQLAPERPNAAGLLAAGLIWFSPNILAHARLVTTDAGAAFFVTLSLFALFLFTRRPNLLRALLSGATLGLAQLVTFIAGYLWITHLATLALFFALRPAIHRARLTLLSALIFIAALLTLNAGYAFDNVGVPLRAFTFRSTECRDLQALLPGALPVPLPAAYLQAFDQHAANAEQSDPSYLFGKLQRGGRWFYFPVLIALKTPLPLLLLAALALGLFYSRDPRDRFEQLLLWIPIAFLFVMLSLCTKEQTDLRMTLPLAVPFWLWVATTLARFEWTRRTVAVPAVLIAWLAIETLLAYPHYLVYFNPLAGGPSKGYRYAIDSNSDWGQDLPLLKKYMDQNNLRSIQLLYFGRVDPAIYGIQYEIPLLSIAPGYLAISRTLCGRGYFLYDHGTVFRGGPFQPESMPSMQRVATLGNSIDVYRVPPATR